MFKTLALILLTAAPAFAQDFPAGEMPPGLVSARLMPGWVTPDGARMTALQVELEPGWKTYWRSPGDAGIPPHFDWQAAEKQLVRVMPLEYKRVLQARAEQAATLAAAAQTKEVA